MQNSQQGKVPHSNTKEELEWWKRIDKSSLYLSKLWGGMFGTCSQRVSKLYLIRNNIDFKLKENT